MLNRRDILRASIFAPLAAAIGVKAATAAPAIAAVESVGPLTITLPSAAIVGMAYTFYSLTLADGSVVKIRPGQVLEINQDGRVVPFNAASK